MNKRKNSKKKKDSLLFGKFKLISIHLQQTCLICRFIAQGLNQALKKKKIPTCALHSSIVAKVSVSPSL
jgi:hypothetical protein